MCDCGGELKKDLERMSVSEKEERITPFSSGLKEGQGSRVCSPGLQLPRPPPGWMVGATLCPPVALMPAGCELSVLPRVEALSTRVDSSDSCQLDRCEEHQVWASLVVQWLGACLSMQGTQVRALVWENPTCRGATRPVSHNY